MRMTERPEGSSAVGDEAATAVDEAGAVEASSAGKGPVRRRRGKIRLKVLIEATDALLESSDVSEIGLYQIAERAGVPPASIYHFFPNKEAALIAVAEDYLLRFKEVGLRPLDPRPANWQELIAARVRGAARFYNEHVSLMRLFLGASLSAEVRKRDMAGTFAMAETRAELLERYFVVPPVPGWIGKLATSIAISDGIWALSYSQHGCIPDDAVEEGVRAVTAYLRSYLPDWLEPRAIITAT